MREKGQYSKGMIMDFVDKAVLNMLAIERGEADFRNGGNTHTHFPSKALELRNRIIEWLKTNYKYEDLEAVTIAKPMLVNAIIATEGCTDRRTVTSRIDLLISKRCIRESEDSDKLNKRYVFILDSKYLNKE